jgi:hypothetical protein
MAYRKVRDHPDARYECTAIVARPGGVARTMRVRSVRRRQNLLIVPVSRRHIRRFNHAPAPYHHIVATGANMSELLADPQTATTYAELICCALGVARGDELAASPGIGRRRKKRSSNWAIFTVYSRDCWGSGMTLRARYTGRDRAWREWRATRTNSPLSMPCANRSSECAFRSRTG